MAEIGEKCDKVFGLCNVNGRLHGKGEELVLRCTLACRWCMGGVGGFGVCGVFHSKNLC